MAANKGSLSMAVQTGVYVDDLPIGEERKRYIIEVLDPILEGMVTETLAEMPAQPIDFLISWLRRRKSSCRTANFAEDVVDNSDSNMAFGKKRSSVFAAQSFGDLGASLDILGGRIVEMPTRSEQLGPLECVLIEPAGKRLSPDQYSSTGLVVCLHGMPPTAGIIEEWCGTVRRVGWLESGISVAIPNFQMSAALKVEDSQAVVDAACELAGSSGCIIAGKGWGARQAVEIATNASGSSHKIEGLILAAPGLPVPFGCNNLSLPVLLVWAHDDDVQNFDEGCEAWGEALQDLSSPVQMHDVETGGHSLAEMVTDESIASAIKRFANGAFLISDLEADAETEDAEGAPCMTKCISERTRRLTCELPDIVHRLSTDEGSPSKRELMERTKSWIDSGMASAAE